MTGVSVDSSYLNWLAGLKARQLAGTAGFTRDDVADVTQELLLEAFLRLPRYEPERASPKTFINAVMRNRVADLIELKTARRRDYRLVSALPSDDVRASDPDPPDLSIDVRRALARLTPREQEVCLRLSRGESCSAIGRALGLSRTSVWRAMRSARTTFQALGLEAYL